MSNASKVTYHKFGISNTKDFFYVSRALKNRYESKMHEGIFLDLCEKNYIKNEKKNEIIN